MFVCMVTNQSRVNEIVLVFIIYIYIVTCIFIVMDI